MTVTLDEFKRLKAALDKRKSEASKAEGAYEEAMDRLKQLGFKSVKEARQGIADMDIQLNELQTSYDNQLGEFKERWGEELGL